MKKTKKIFGICMAIALLVLITGSVEKTAEASKSYWLTGGSGISSLKYTGKKFIFSGKWGKGSSLNKSAKIYYKKAKTLNKSVKKGKIKTGFIGSDGLSYDKKANIDKNKELVGITIHIKIKGNKVTEIINSAM